MSDFNNNLNTDPENAKWLLNELSQSDLDDDSLDVRFELEDGTDSGCDVLITDIADLALKYIELLESQLNPK